MAKIQGDEFAMTIASRNLQKLGQPEHAQFRDIAPLISISFPEAAIVLVSAGIATSGQMGFWVR